VVEPYTPLFRNPDLHTIAGRFWPAPLEPGEARLFSTGPGVQVLAHCHFRDPAAPLLLLVHGLEGSSDSPYMRATAREALAAGFDVLRLNVRNCGSTEHLCPTLYHSGLTADLRSVIEQLAPRRICLLGFSMGGNQALKLAGEWADRAPAHLVAVIGISTPIDLASSARRIGEPRNRLYEIRFMRSLRARMRRKAHLWPNLYSAAGLDRLRSVVDFDHQVTAPAFGFRDAWDYYEQSSARNYLASICIPALLLQAQDDPFIPFDPYRRLPPNPRLQILTPTHGGHVAFLSRTPPRFWAARQAVRFCQSYVESPLLSHR